MTEGLALRLDGRFSCINNGLCSNIKGRQIENFRWMNDTPNFLHLTTFQYVILENTKLRLAKFNSEIDVFDFRILPRVCINISLPLPIKYVCARDIMHFKLFYRISMKFNTAQHPEWPMHRQVAKHEMICLLMLATCRYTNSTHFCNLILQKSVRYSCSQFRILNAWLTVFLFIYIADIYRYQFLA